MSLDSSILALKFLEEKIPGSGRGISYPTKIMEQQRSQFVVILMETAMMRLQLPGAARDQQQMIFG